MNAQHNSQQNAADLDLRSAALNGDSAALGRLIERHRDFLYNVVWRMTLNPQDAEDITQDIIIKIITNLAKFRGESAFKTWAYRIAFNHVINLPKRPLEQAITSFDQYGAELDALPDRRFPETGEPSAEDKLVIEEAMLGCTAGMLMCLDRQQRLIYILGEMFEIDSKTGAEILGISADNFRQQLSRARKQLYNFMTHKCGLVNKTNPCRCQKKTKAFIENGWVDPRTLKFNTAYRKRISQRVTRKHKDMESVLDNEYAAIFRDHPFQEKPAITERIKAMLRGKDFREIFEV